MKIPLTRSGPRAHDWGIAENHPEPQVPAGRSNSLMALLIAAATIAVLVAANAPFLSTYSVKGDDHAVLLHSSRFFSPSPTEWVTEGYSDYNVTFPEGGSPTNFIRPSVNASVYLDSLLTSNPLSVSFLLTNYVGHAAVTAIVFLLGIRLFGLTRLSAAIASLVFAGTVASEGLTRFVAFRGDMLATLFALLALMVAVSYSERGPSVLKLVAISLLLAVSLFAKEAALAAPAVVLLYLMFHSLRIKGSHLLDVRNVGPLFATSIPFLVYVGAVLSRGFSNNYAVEDLPARVFGIPTLFLNPLRFFATAFFPVETSVVKAALSSPTQSLMEWATIRGGLAVLANLLVWVMAFRAIRNKARPDRLPMLLGLGVLASALPIVLKAEPRFMYFGQSLLLPLVVLVGTWSFDRWKLNRNAPKLALIPVAVGLLIGPVYLVGSEVAAQADRVSENHLAEHLRRVILNETTPPTINRLYVVNAPPVLTPGVPALEFLSSLNDREDLAFRIVNTYNGVATGETVPNEGVRFSFQGDDLVGTVLIGKGDQFLGVSTTDVPGIISFEPLEGIATNEFGRQVIVGRSLTFRIPESNEDFVIVGLDPAQAGVFVYRSIEGEWARASF